MSDYKLSLLLKLNIEHRSVFVYVLYPLLGGSARWKPCARAMPSCDHFGVRKTTLGSRPDRFARGCRIGVDDGEGYEIGLIFGLWDNSSRSTILRCQVCRNVSFMIFLAGFFPSPDRFRKLWLHVFYALLVWRLYDKKKWKVTSNPIYCFDRTGSYTSVRLAVLICFSPEISLPSSRMRFIIIVNRAPSAFDISSFQWKFNNWKKGLSKIFV